MLFVHFLAKTVVRCIEDFVGRGLALGCRECLGAELLDARDVGVELLSEF